MAVLLAVIKEPIQLQIPDCSAKYYAMHQVQKRAAAEAVGPGRQMHPGSNLFFFYYHHFSRLSAAHYLSNSHKEKVLFISEVLLDSLEYYSVVLFGFFMNLGSLNILNIYRRKQYFFDRCVATSEQTYG